MTLALTPSVFLSWFLTALAVGLGYALGCAIIAKLIR